MRTNLIALCCAGALALGSGACKKSSMAPADANTAQQTSAQLKSNSVADHVIETGMTLKQINDVIAGASSGQTVYVQPGTYTITGRINFKKGVSIVKQTATNPIFDGTGASAIQRFYYTDADMTNTTISGITFWNIRLQITSTVKTVIKYCLFDYGKRAAGTNKTNNLLDDYVRLVSTDSAQVSNSVFCHRSTDPGRGVWVSTATNTKILNNTFGNGGTTGYFVCAVNDNSQSNTLIDGNTLNRNTALNSLDSLTDHGVYCHSFNGLVISNNNISGWPTTGSGGAVKVRNGQNVSITGNTMNDSGVLLYEYSNLPAFPYLKNVTVTNNTINISAPANDIYHGIGYYRDNTTDTEYSINITGNTLPNGAIVANSSNIDVTNFNAAGGGVFNNDTAAGYLLLKSGISNSGNF